MVEVQSPVAHHHILPVLQLLHLLDLTHLTLRLLALHRPIRTLHLEVPPTTSDHILVSVNRC